MPKKRRSPAVLPSTEQTPIVKVKLPKPKKDITITVMVDTPWSNNEMVYEIKNVSPGFKHKDNRWGLVILKGLQAEYGNCVKQR